MFDQLVTCRTALEGLVRDFDLFELPAPKAVRLLDELGAIQRMVYGMVAKAAKQVAESNAHVITGERNANELVARTLGVGNGEARAAIETARRLELLPKTDAAVQRGELSAKQAQMIAEAASHNPAAEASLLEAARQGLVPLKDACIAARAAVEDPAERSERQHKSRFLRTWTDADGMFAGRFRLTPEVGGQLKEKLDAEVQRMFRERRAGTDHEPHEAYAADALADFALNGGSKTRRTNFRVHIVVDHAALKRGNVLDGERSEIPGVGPVNVEWVRGLLGDAFLTAVIAKGKDIRTVAHLGRHIPAELRTALVVQGLECTIEDCNCRGYLEIDHIHDYAKGGPTTYENVGPMCSIHHRLKSQGWTLGPPGPKTGKRKLRPPPSRAG